MQKFVYGIVDDLTEVALGRKSASQVHFGKYSPLEWRTAAVELENHKMTLAEALEVITGKDAKTVNYGEEATTFSGVHGKSANLVKIAPARRTTGIEKRPVRKVNKIIVHTMKRTADGRKICVKSTTMVRKPHTVRTFVEA